MRNCRGSFALLCLLPMVHLLSVGTCFVLKPLFFSPPTRVASRSVSLQAFNTLRSKKKYDLNLLVVDHYDSFTYNLVDLLAQFCQKAPTVVAWDALLVGNDTLWQNQEYYDGIILSPGPGHPVEYASSMRFLEQQYASGNTNTNNERTTPILGVCLGHQMLGLVNGASVVPAPEPVHGQVWECELLTTNQRDDMNRAAACKYPSLFQNVSSSSFVATRYHSLQVILDKEDVSCKLQPTAFTTITEDDIKHDRQVLMALQSTHYPHYGVQFHPESIGSTTIGRQLIQNFLNICKDVKAQRRTPETDPSNVVSAVDNVEAQEQLPDETLAPSSLSLTPPFSVYIAKLESTTNKVSLSPEQVMEIFYKDEPFCFWLDHASFQEASSVCKNNDTAVSILGASKERVEYWTSGSSDGSSDVTPAGYILEYKNQSSSPVRIDQDIFEYLSQAYHPSRRSNTITMVNFSHDGDDPVLTIHDEQDEQIAPFDYRGGHVGYLGYEARYDTQRYLEQLEGHESEAVTHPTIGEPTLPTAAFLLARRSCVYHHSTQTWYLVGIGQSDQDKGDVLKWMQCTSDRMAQHRSGTDGLLNVMTRRQPINLEFVPSRSQKVYNDNFDKSKKYIRLGESYELCLTNKLEATIPTVDSDAFSLYKTLRRINPAPHAAYLNWNGQQSSQRSKGSVSICCSSPERFVSVKRKNHTCFEVEAKPIKGTRARLLPSVGQQRSDSELSEDARRAAELQMSVKDRAENLMIVDLLRNDLSRVCQVGTVHVPKLMEIESYTTVHQMVSTIRGYLDSTKSTAVDVLKACFPGGSMTGAPKIRTMQLLAKLEDNVSRGPYSGCLGYLSVNGCADMNIVIRSAVLTPHSQQQTKISVGAGGAITALSERVDEYDEMMLKASAVIVAVEEWASKKGSSVPPLSFQECNGNETMVVL